MAIGLVLHFDMQDGVDLYEGVMGEDALDLHSPRNPDAGGDWPTGIIAHYAGATPNGWCVVDIWESQERFDDFMSTRLGPAMAKNNVPEPDVISFELYSSHT